MKSQQEPTLFATELSSSHAPVPVGRKFAQKLRRVLWLTLLGVVAFGLIAPFLRADWLRPRIEAALEAALGRPVHISGRSESLHRPWFYSQRRPDR
jgi:hypothetical protein